MSYIVWDSEEGREYKSHNYCKNKYFWLDECDQLRENWEIVRREASMLLVKDETAEVLL